MWFVLLVLRFVVLEFWIVIMCIIVFMEVKICFCDVYIVFFLGFYFFLKILFWWIIWFFELFSFIIVKVEELFLLLIKEMSDLFGEMEGKLFFIWVREIFGRGDFWYLIWGFIVWVFWLRFLYLWYLILFELGDMKGL